MTENQRKKHEHRSGATRVPKLRWLARVAYALLIASGLLVSVSVGFFFYRLPDHNTGSPPTLENVRELLRCADDNHRATIRGQLKVANASSGGPYADSIIATPGDKVNFQLWVSNRELSRDVLDLRARLTLAESRGLSIPVTAHTCGSNTELAGDSATVESLDIPIGLHFNPTSVSVNSYDDGEWSSRGGSRSFLSSEGMTLGRLKPFGNPGSGQVMLAVAAKVEAADSPRNVHVQCYVRGSGQGQNSWNTWAVARPGDELDFMIRFENPSALPLMDVVVGNNLPKYLAYVEGSTELRNGAFPSGIDLESDNIVSGGINVGHYRSGAVGYVLFRARVGPVPAYERFGTYDLRNVAVVRAEGLNEYYNTANVLLDVRFLDDSGSSRPSGSEGPR